MFVIIEFLYLRYKVVLSLEIKYLKHNQIDKQKWDSAIENSQNALVYALSWFLNIMSPEWDALIFGNYDLVMPLTHRKRLGIKYLYQPVFIQQLGIFFTKDISKETVRYFIDETKINFKFIDIQLNFANPKLETESFILRNTQLIDISKSYDDLLKSYSKNHKKNLKKINESGLVINSKGNSSDFIDLISNMFVKKGVDEITQINISNLKRIIDYCFEKGLGELYFGYLGDELCASAFFLKWGKRVILYTALNELGRNAGAMFGLIDKYLNENSGQDLLFDFAGSNIPGVKYRNLGFGAENEIYYRVKIN
jgi:hypothetical protein